MRMSMAAGVLTALVLSSSFAQAADKPKICFVYPGLKTDGGWSEAQDRGRLEVEKQFGDRIQTSYAESVPESAAALPVLDKLANSSCNMIFATAFGYMDAVLAAAQKYPAVKFEHLGGYKTTRNVSVYNARFYEGRYLTGRIAARMSKSGQAAYIAPFPIPEVMQASMPSHSARSRSIRASRRRFTGQGPGSIPRKKRKLPALPPLKNRHHHPADRLHRADAGGGNKQSARLRLWQRSEPHRPALPVNGDRLQLGAYDTARVKAYLEGSWVAEVNWDGLSSGIITMAPYRNMPADIVKFAQSSEQKIAGGALLPFHGPVRTQASKTWLKKNETAQDSVLLSMDFFVLGVVGDIPKAAQ